MCNEILVIKDGQSTVCENMGELSAATGLPFDVLLPELGGPHDPLDCLCHVDAEELGGRVATEDEGWPFVRYAIEDAAIHALATKP